MDKKNEKPTFEDLKQLSIGVNWDSETKIQEKKVDFTKGTKNRSKKKKGILKRNRLDYYITCHPIESIFKKLVDRIKQKGISYKIEDAVRYIIDKKELSYNFVGINKFCFTKFNSTFFLHDKSLLEYMFIKKNNLIVENEHRLISAPENVPYIYKCKVTDKLLPPTSFDKFKNIAAHHLYENSIIANLEDFIKGLIKIDDQDLINKFKSEKIKLHSYKIKEYDNKTFESLIQLKEYLVNLDNLEKIPLIEKVDSFSVLEKNVLNLDKYILKELNSYQKERSAIIRHVTESLKSKIKKENLLLFKNDRNAKLYMGPFRKKIPKQKMNHVCESILALVEKDSPNHFKEISKSISEKGNTTEINVLSEIKWLAKSGYIRMYEDGFISI